MIEICFVSLITLFIINRDIIDTIRPFQNHINYWNDFKINQFGEKRNRSTCQYWRKTYFDRKLTSTVHFDVLKVTGPQNWEIGDPNYRKVWFCILMSDWDHWRSYLYYKSNKFIAILILFISYYLNNQNRIFR